MAQALADAATIGIDIREGPNFACINCGLCVDACDEVMDKVGRPRGLIAYDTDAAVEARPLNSYAIHPIVGITDDKLIPAKTGAGDVDIQVRYLRFDNYTFLKQSEKRNQYHVRLWEKALGSQIALYPNLNAEDPEWRTLMRDVRFRRALSLDPQVLLLDEPTNHLDAESVAWLERYLKEYNNFDFFFIHYKYTDKAGEDGDFDAKVAALERFDAQLPAILTLKPDVLAVSGDHATPSILAAHGWQPVPALVASGYCGADHVSRFTERDCATGALGLAARYNSANLLMRQAAVVRAGALRGQGAGAGPPRQDPKVRCAAVAAG